MKSSLFYITGSSFQCLFHWDTKSSHSVTQTVGGNLRKNKDSRKPAKKQEKLNIKLHLKCCSSVQAHTSGLL